MGPGNEDLFAALVHLLACERAAERGQQ